MTRLAEWAIALLIILAVGAVLVFMPPVTAPRIDPATVARVERLEAEVDVLRRQLAETDLARWKIEKPDLGDRGEGGDRGRQDADPYARGPSAGDPG
jgi:hypothetical protein